MIKRAKSVKQSSFITITVKTPVYYQACIDLFRPDLACAIKSC